MIILLIISIIGFSTGVYFKFIKSFSDEKLQVEKTNLVGVKNQRQLKLGEMISMLKELESIRKEDEIAFNENDVVLKRLRVIHTVSIIVMIFSCVVFIWSINKVRKETFL